MVDVGTPIQEKLIGLLGRSRSFRCLFVIRAQTTLAGVGGRHVFVLSNIALTLQEKPTLKTMAALITDDFDVLA